MTYLLGISSIVLAVAASTPATAQAVNFAKEAAAMIEASTPGDGPGVTVIVTRGGKVIYSGARGLADLSSRVSLRQDTPIRLGSITKQFTAAIVLQLAAEGKLSLTDPVSRFFPDFPAPGASATVRQLLNHSSGLMDFTKIPGWMMSEPSLRPNTTADLVALIASRPATAQPGTQWEYNNGGYVMLGAIIEKVIGKAWHEAVIQRIARPLGLRTIRYAGNTMGASGYSLVKGEYAPASGVHISVAHAAGGLIGSVDDLARWANALHHGRVVSPQLYAEMTTPMHLNDGSAQPYGYGLRIRELRGRTAFVHGGAGRGLDADSVYIPSKDVFVAVLANTDDPATDPSVLTRRLAALAVGQPVPTSTRADVPLASLQPLFGSYQSENGPPRRFFARDGKIYIARGDEEAEVVATGGNRFSIVPDGLTSFTITRQGNGAYIMSMDSVEAATLARAIRTGDAPPQLTVPRELLQRYEGTYQTEGPTLVLAVDENGRLGVAPTGQNAQSLRPVSTTEFRVEGTPMRIVFHPDGARIDRFTLYRGARELHGKRVP